MGKDDIATLIYVGQSWLPILLLMVVFWIFVMRPIAKQKRAIPGPQADMGWWHKHKALRIIACTVWALG